ncbi:probable calcium-binding protein CML22 [Rhodamnia argentea]|uniref:Probable calcium-binding protein CML22 n=1 Tax=Rhodamnia argentea TaxID=178133 RepID=A0A8B8R173_9MYRT|nr:probable calcium-binding protein CML22 [Rhodamnia argentea]
MFYKTLLFRSVFNSGKNHLLSPMQKITMKGQIGTSCPCPSLKAVSNKVGTILCHRNSQIRNKKLDAKLEKKVLEVKNTLSTRRNKFQTINSIIMRFPQFKEGLKDIKAIFQQYDEDSNGTIDKEELKKCLEEMQLHLSEKDMEDLFHSCDIDENQEIQFREYIVLLCLIYLLKEASSTNETEKIGSPSIEATFDAIIEAFLFLDKDGDGKLKKKDVIKALNEASPTEKTPRHVTMKRFKEMDWGRKGKVSFREFLFTFVDWVGVETNHGEGDGFSYGDCDVYGDDLPS